MRLHSRWRRLGWYDMLEVSAANIATPFRKPGVGGLGSYIHMYIPITMKLTKKTPLLAGLEQDLIYY
jgi:hypothetical protein